MNPAIVASLACMGRPVRNHGSPGRAAGSWVVASLDQRGWRSPRSFALKTHIPAWCWTLRTRDRVIQRRPSSLKINSSRRAIWRMTAMTKGAASRKNMLAYSASSRQLPAPRKKGRYGTPIIIAGRVQPRNNTSLCIPARYCLQHDGDGATGVADEHLGDLRRRADQEAADQDRCDIGNALVCEGNLVAREDHRNRHHRDRRQVEQAVDVLQEAGDLAVGTAEVRRGLCQRRRRHGKRDGDQGQCAWQAPGVGVLV